MPKESPLAPDHFPAMPPVPGVRLAAIDAGLRYKRKDVMLAELAEGATIAGVFTTSQTAAAPVQWCRRLLPHGRVRAIIVNAGNANAFTGQQGVEACAATAKAVAQVMMFPEDEIYVASTGVIGEPLPYQKITNIVPGLHAELSEHAWEAAADAIRTTDTFSKYATRTAEIDGVTVTLNGITKGSGMIAPNMATMLGFCFTDAALSAPVLQTLLEDANAKSFNAITVDGDCSTNDTVLLCASGASGAGADITDPQDARLDSFRQALHGLATELAQLIIRDGEGATKLVTVTVEEAASEADAKAMAFSIANSPLVKTAIAGEDPNWGRLVMAVGKAGVTLDQLKLWVKLGDIMLAENGVRHPDYKEAQGADYMKGDELTVTVGIGAGDACFTVWTCDLTHDYIAINADYRS